jgi:hypothetical protein
MALGSGVPASGARLLRGIGNAGWGVGTFVLRKDECCGRWRNGSAGCGATKGRRGSLSKCRRRWVGVARGWWKSNSPMVSGSECEGKPRWFTPEIRRILAYRKPVDLRKSIDGLVGLVKSGLAEDPLSGSLFVFVNRRGNWVKLVSGDRTGWCLFAKR